LTALQVLFDRAKRVSKKLLSFEWRKTREEERTTLTCSKAYSSRQSEMERQDQESKIGII